MRSTRSVSPLALTALCILLTSSAWPQQYNKGSSENKAAASAPKPATNANAPATVQKQPSAAHAQAGKLAKPGVNTQTATSGSNHTKLKQTAPKSGGGGAGAQNSAQAPEYLQEICSTVTLTCVRSPSAGASADGQPITLLLPAGLIAANMPFGLNSSATSSSTKPNPIMKPDCSGLLASGRTVIATDAVVTRLGKPPSPFTVTSYGDTLFIYSSDANLKPQEKQTLSQLEAEIGQVIAVSAGFEIDLEIPHASTLSNLASSLQAAAPDGLTVTSTGATTVRLVSDGTVSCAAARDFIKETAKFAHHTAPDTPIASVFYLDLASTGSALQGTPIPYAAGGAAALTGAAASSPPSTNTPTGSNATGGGGTPTSSNSAGGGGSKNANSSKGSTGQGSTGSKSGGNTGSKGAGSSATTITVAPVAAAQTGSGGKQQNAKNTTSADQNSQGPTITVATTAANPSGTDSEDAQSEPGPQSTSSPAFSVNGRDLYFAGGTIGDDAWITEKKRALALLDLPQPQVLVNAWVMQSSTTKVDQSGQLTMLVDQTVNSFNDTIQQSIDIGWSKLRSEAKAPGFFDDDFYNYLTLRTVIDPQDSQTPQGSPTQTPQSSQSGSSVSAEAILRGNGDGFYTGKKEAVPFGICPPNQYCLGYLGLFQPGQPRLTDMLLTLIAAQSPAIAAGNAINEMERGIALVCDGGEKTSEVNRPPCTELANPCKAAAKKKELSGSIDNELCRELFARPDKAAPLYGCQQADEVLLLKQDQSHPQNQILPLECFRTTMQLADGIPDENGKNRKHESQIGLVRAAVADFLFNYKMSQEFPHEFPPYDLTASAQLLDASLAPFIHAFNEDLQAFQTFVRAKLVTNSLRRGVSGDKNTFLNDGLITVQTTSGDLATVSTGTQSFMNVSKAPSISQLASSVVGAGSSGNPATGVLANLSPNEAQVLLGALAAYQTTTLNVGRQLNLVVKPRSLLGASAAEMDVQLNADQAPNSPSYWSASGGTGTPADLSQVTQHDTTTHVRIDSIRLFNISSLTAILSKGRDKFPVLPPFVEIPYIGTLLGIPLPAAREFHTSSAVVSAVIVPTATDIAYSLRFASDRIVQNSDGKDGSCHWPLGADKAPNCVSRKATSLSDFGQPLREFHHAKLHCLITYPAPIPSQQSTEASGESACKNLSFADVLHDASE